MGGLQNNNLTSAVMGAESEPSRDSGVSNLQNRRSPSLLLISSAMCVPPPQNLDLLRAWLSCLNRAASVC